MAEPETSIAEAILAKAKLARIAKSEVEGRGVHEGQTNIDIGKRQDPKVQKINIAGTPTEPQALLRGLKIRIVSVAKLLI